MSSFLEWFDHTLVDRADAYTNTSGQLFSMNDPRLGTGIPTYSSPNYQWVADQSISGAYIPTAASLGVPFVDYNNGRTISGAPSGIVQYSYKTFNTYLTSESDERLILEQKFTERANPRKKSGITGLAPHLVVLPCVFLRNSQSKTREIAFESIGRKYLSIEALILADSDFKREAVASTFSDFVGGYFPWFEETPFNVLGDYKTGGYNYMDQYRSYQNSSNLVYISDIMYSPLSSTIQSNSIIEAYPKLRIGKMVFSVEYDTFLNRRLT